MSAHEEVARQLVESVAARRRAGRALATVGIGRWWRGHLGMNAFATALCAVLMVLALGAAGSSPLGQHGTGGAGPGKLVASVGAGEAACPPCRAVGGRLHAPLSDEATASANLPGGRREVLVRAGRPAVLWGGERG